jgi:hypothetical protein
MVRVGCRENIHSKVGVSTEMTTATEHETANLYELADVVVNTLTETAIKAQPLPELAHLLTLIRDDAAKVRRFIASLPLAVILNPQTIADQQVAIQAMEDERTVLRWLLANTGHLIIVAGDGRRFFLRSVEGDALPTLLFRLAASDGSNLRATCISCGNLKCTGCGEYGGPVPLNAPAEVEKIFAQRRP